MVNYPTLKAETIDPSSARNKIFIALIVIGLASGSGFFLGHSLMKPSQILPLVGLFYLPWQVAKHRLNYDRLALWLVLYIFLASFYNLPGLDKDQLIDFGYVLSTFFVYMAAYLSAGFVLKGSQFPAKLVLLLFAALFGLYLFQISTGTYFLPGADTDLPYSVTFNNSNDLDSFLVAFIPLILFCVQRFKVSALTTLAVFFALAMWVIVLGSRFCIVALFIIPFMFALFSRNYIVKLMLLSLAGFIGALLSQLNWKKILDGFSEVDNLVISRSATRLALFLFDRENDKSSSYRVESYLYAINNMDDAIFGVGTKNYDLFYAKGFGADTLVAFVPHSYLIENMIAFGWAGLLLILLMLGTCLVPLLKDKALRFYGLTSFLLFLAVSFVPSTVIRMPLLWFPLFFFTCLARQSMFEFSWDSLPSALPPKHEQELYRQAY